MSIHINEVMDYLDAHPIGCYEGSVKSLMEMLHDVYVAYNSVDNEELRRLFQRFDSILKDFPADGAEELRASICDLCREHEVLAFSHGIVVGMNLMTEIRTLP